MADILWNWIDPSWTQFLIVNIGWMILGFIIALSSVAGFMSRSDIAKVAGIVGFIVLFIVGIYIMVINGRSIYLMIDNGVEGTDWFLLIMYALAFFGALSPGGSAKRFN